MTAIHLQTNGQGERYNKTLVFRRQMDIAKNQKN